MSGPKQYKISSFVYPIAEETCTGPEKDEGDQISGGSTNYKKIMSFFTVWSQESESLCNTVEHLTFRDDPSGIYSRPWGNQRLLYKHCLSLNTF